MDHAAEETEEAVEYERTCVYVRANAAWCIVCTCDALCG